jgi:energy-coupling factor transport system permease protein
MSTEYDLYVHCHSWVHKLDPRVKLAFVIEASLLLFLRPTIATALGVILLCSAGYWQAQIPPGRVGRILGMMGPLLMLVFGLTAIFGDSDSAAWLRLGPLAVTAESVYQASMLTLRLLALALIVFLWLFTTDQATMVRGFQALHVPYTWGLTLALALRYLPIFAGLYGQVRQAQQARGLDLAQLSFGQRLRAYQPVLVAMIINALRQSERLGWAMEARALGAQDVRRTIFRPLHMKRLDYGVLAALCLFLVIGAVSAAL